MRIWQSKRESSYFFSFKAHRNDHGLRKTYNYIFRSCLKIHLHIFFRVSKSKKIVVKYRIYLLESELI